MPEINTSKPKKPDIYSFGFRKSLNREIPDESTGVVYDYLGDSLNVAQLLSGGDLTLKSLSIGGLVKQVAPGDDIQAAINAIAREGGGTIQLLAKTYIITNNIVLKSGVAIVGAGRDQTILDFEGRGFGIIVSGIQTEVIKNFVISNLTIRNSNATAGIDLLFASFFRFENLKVTSCDQKGIRFDGCNNFILDNIITDNNTGNGIEVKASDSTKRCREWVMIDCLSEDNTGDGFSIADDGPTGGSFRATLINCIGKENGVINFDLDMSDIT